MQTRLLHEDNGQRTFPVILETGEEVLTCLRRFVNREKVLAAQITAIGAMSDVVLMYFDWGQKELSEDSGARTGGSPVTHRRKVPRICARLRIRNRDWRSSGRSFDHERIGMFQIIAWAVVRGR